MKREAIFFLFILLTFNIPFIYSATEEGYGEGNANLGQFTDSFENADNVTVMVDVINNQTLDCMELNYTSVIEVTNNTFQLKEHKTYATPNPDITFSIVGGEVLQTDSTLVAQGYGYNFLYGDTSFLEGKYLRFRWKYWDTSGAIYPMYMLIYDGKYDRSNTTDFPSGSGILLKGDGVLYTKRENTVGRNVWKTWDIQIPNTATLPDLTILYQLVDAWNGQDTQMSLDWIEINNNSGGVNNLWRIDFNGTQNVVMEVTATANDYGYMNNSGLPITTGGFEKEGYFITDDYLNYTTGNTLALLTNASIPSGTSMTVQFSNDNSTWVDNEGNVGSTPIGEGFYSIDLRDLNYTNDYKMVNFTGTLSLTPRLYQLREITTMGGAGETIFQNVTGTWILYNATSISVIVGTYEGGFLNSTYFKGDSNIYNVTETTGSPAWNIEYNFTGLPIDEGSMICLCIDHWLYYDGNVQHDIWFEVYNYTSSSWVEIGILQDMTEFGWNNYTVQCIPTDLIDNGNVRARIIHDDLGNINHHIYFDYIVLKVFIPFEVVVSGGINSSGILIVILLLTIGSIVLLGVRKR